MIITVLDYSTGEVLFIEQDLVDLEHEEIEELLQSYFNLDEIEYMTTLDMPNIKTIPLSELTECHPLI